ncbi:MAG: chromosomal replication initiator protein DnaA [Spirochaetaceae bacterium]
MSSIEYDIFWYETIKQLKEENLLSEQECSMWFNNMKYTSSNEDNIVLSVPSKFYKDQIKLRYSSLLEKKLFELSGTSIKLDFTIIQKEIANTEKIRPNIAKTNNSDIKTDKFTTKTVNITNSNPQHYQLNENYTFENYVIGDNNSLPTNAGKAIVNNPGKDYNPCLIYGGVGLGKTHLMQAIGNGIHNKHPEMKIVYIPAETFINEFINSISTNTQSKFKSKYRKVDVLLIDDIHDLQNKNSTQEELFHTFNALYDSNKQLVFTCDRPPSELQKFSDRLKSRFERGLNVDLLPPDFETRVAILRNKLNEKNVDIPDEVLNFMSKNITTNIRDLEAALTKLIAYAELVGKKITMDVAKTQLKHVFQKPLQLNITIDKVQKAVAEYFNVTTNDLKSKKRTKVVTFPRQVAMYIIREITDFSTTEIGLEFGGRDHTTVMHSCQKIEDMTITNSTLEPTINNIVRTIKESGGN